MLKKYTFIDFIFLSTCAVFAALSLYELVKFLIPLYTYLRAISIFVIVMGAYVGYNFIPRKKILTESTPQALETQTSRTFKNIFHQIFNYSLTYKQQAVYISFIILSLCIIISQIYDITVLSVYSAIVFILIFVYAKLLGFESESAVTKSQIRSFNTLRFFLILYAIFFVVLNYIFDRFEIPDQDHTKLYIIFSALYLISGYIIFFDSSKVSAAITRFIFQKLLRPYSVAMTILIVGLGGYLIMKNDLIEQVQQGAESLEVTEITQGGIKLPGVVSGDLALVEDVALDENVSNIEYQTVLVSDVYNIETGLALGSIGQSVVELQTVLGNLQYFLGEVNGDFGEDTQLALTQALQSECAWPDTTRGIFGPQAKECIDNLEISRKIQVPETDDQSVEENNL